MARRARSLSAMVNQVLAKPFSRFGDRQLLERFVERGDELAFGAIVDRHGPMLLGLCRRQVGDAHLAEDVLQATFLVLARKAQSICNRESLAGWLYGVAQRLARQARLAETARSRRDKRAGEERGQIAAGDPAWDELLRVLDEELQKLAERHRLPLLLCYLEGRTQDEAARQLKWSLSTLRRRLEEGRELLKTRLTRRGATLGAGLFASFLAPSAVRAALTMEVRHAVLMTAKAGSNGVVVSASVIALANGALRMSIFAKMFICAAAATAVCATVTGAVWQMGPATQAVESRRTPLVQPADNKAVIQEAPQLKMPLAGRDIFDDPLPKGAVARLGTVAFRHGTVNVISTSDSLTFTPDGKQLISSGGGWLRRWDVATGRANVKLGDGPWTDHHVIDYFLTANGQFASGVGYPDQPIKEFDLQTGGERSFDLEFKSKLELSPNRTCYLSPDGKLIGTIQALGGRPPTPSNAVVPKSVITLWGTANGKRTHRFEPDKGSYLAMAFSPAGNAVVAADDSHAIHVIELSTGKKQLTFGIPNSKEEITQLGVQVSQVDSRIAISPDGKSLATFFMSFDPPKDFCICLWNLETGTLRKKLDLGEYSRVSSLVFTPDSQVLIAGVGKSIRTWIVGTGQPGLAWTVDSGRYSHPTAIAVSPDGRTVATMSEVGVIRLWGLKTGHEVHRVDVSTSAVESVSFSQDSKTITTIGTDFVLRQYDGADGRLLAPARKAAKEGYQPLWSTLWEGGKTQVTSFNKIDGKFSATAGILQVCDSATGKVLLEEKGWLAVVSLDGKRVAARGKDDIRDDIRVFEVESGKLLHQFTLPHPNFKLRAFTPGGQALIVQGETVSIWDLQTVKQKSSWNVLETVGKNLVEKTAEKNVLAGEKQTVWMNKEAVKSIAISFDGSKVALAVAKRQGLGKSGGMGGVVIGLVRILVLETATGNPVHQMDVDADLFAYPFPAALAFSADGKRLALGGPAKVSVWDLGTEKAAWEFEGHMAQIKALAFSPDGKRLASASDDSTVLVWELAK
jgi:RNA polymerase sigma factor (sigma-70 family)